MFAIKLSFVFFLFKFNDTNCERRIVNGSLTTDSKRYMVYLVKAPVSPKDYDTWLCGGAIVNKEFVLTSAACVADVMFIYVIAGYDRYVPDDFLDIDECTKHNRKKVIFTCSPVSYQLVYNQVEKWADIDIAVVQVESPYSFKDRMFEIKCSYIPNAIKINFDAKFQAPDTNAIVYGWGHKVKWRSEHDYDNMNSRELRYAAVVISDNEECKKQYANYPNMSRVIDEFMICSLRSANKQPVTVPINVKRSKDTGGCITAQQKLLGVEGKSCEDGEQDNTGYYRTEVSDNSEVKYNGTLPTSFRRHLCQNDHGGPLVTLKRKTEYLIGIASVFRVAQDLKCVGPDLYTSTQKNKAFLRCVLYGEFPSSARKQNKAVYCDSLPIDKGFDTIQKYISWRNHPDGPAENELDDVLK